MNFEIARRVGRPIGDQPSAKSQERKANPYNKLRPPYLTHIDDRAASEESESSEKNSEITSEGGNPRKNF